MSCLDVQQLWNKTFNTIYFQKFPLKFHPEYLTLTLKDVLFIDKWKLKIYELLDLGACKCFWTPHPQVSQTYWSIY